MPDNLSNSPVRLSSQVLDVERAWLRGSSYRYDGAGHQLVRIVEGVTEVQVAAFEQGECELALVLHEPLLVLCSRFGADLPWSAAAFHWQQVPRALRVLPPAPGQAESSPPLVARLVEAADGRVVAQRVVMLTPAFTRVLHEAILEQARYSYDPVDERRALAGLQRRCPGVGGLVAYATVRMKA